MKSTFVAFALSALAPVAFGGPAHYNCLSQSEANTLVDRYGAVISQQPSDIGSPVATARYITNPGYTETSDSANQVLGIPLGAVTVPSKQVFIQESQSNPPVNYNTLGVYVACNVITWQWVDPDFGSGLYEVKGFHLFKVGSNGKLDATFFEFNSVAGDLDTGYQLILPNGTIIP